MKKILLTILSLLLCLSIFSCRRDGDDEKLHYELTDDGTYSVSVGEDRSITAVTIPDTYDGVKVTAVAANGFRGCEKLERVTFGANITNIGDCAFADCKNLSNITLPRELERIGKSAFENCKRLTGIKIPHKVTSIRESTFSGCQNLVSLLIPSSVTSIEAYAFHSCVSLSRVYIDGTEYQYDTMSVDRSYNSYFLGATKYYYSETRPHMPGSFWYYNSDGTVSIWN